MLIVHIMCKYFCQPPGKYSMVIMSLGKMVGNVCMLVKTTLPLGDTVLGEL